MEINEEEIAELFFIEQQKFKEAALEKVRKDGISALREQPTTIKPSWEYLHTTDLDEVIERATEMGWAENKVQVKEYYMTPTRKHYFVEPYEEDCNCPNLLKYEDYAPINTKIED